MYTGVVFDFDGVLYDSEKHWYVIENEYLLDRIATWRPEDYKHLIGRSLPEAYSYLRQHGLLLSEEQYVADYHKMAVRLYSELAKPLKGIHDLLHGVAAKKRKVAIASSSKRTWINTALKANKLSIDIPIIVSAADAEINHGKPAPDVYLRAAYLLQENPSQLIAIEDSKNGVLSAKAAGLYCIGLRNGFNDSQDLTAADRIMCGYSQDNVAEIMRLLK